MTVRRTPRKRCQEIQSDVIPPRGRQPASPETMNTGLRTIGKEGVHRFRARPPDQSPGASRNDSLVFEPIP